VVRRAVGLAEHEAVVLVADASEEAILVRVARHDGRMATIGSRTIMCPRLVFGRSFTRTWPSTRVTWRESDALVPSRSTCRAVEAEAFASPAAARGDEQPRQQVPRVRHKVEEVAQLLGGPGALLAALGRQLGRWRGGGVAVDPVPPERILQRGMQDRVHVADRPRAQAPALLRRPGRVALLGSGRDRGHDVADHRLGVFRELVSQHLRGRLVGVAVEAHHGGPVVERVGVAAGWHVGGAPAAFEQLAVEPVEVNR
jgi:hypothetical protein